MTIIDYFPTEKIWKYIFYHITFTPKHQGKGFCTAQVDIAKASVSEVTQDDFLLADDAIAGSPNYFGSMASEMKNVFDKFVGIRGEMENKIRAAFATSGDNFLMLFP